MTIPHLTELRICGGCGFLLGVSRVCLEPSCGNDYSNDPKAFAALEIDSPEFR